MSEIEFNERQLECYEEGFLAIFVEKNKSYSWWKSYPDPDYKYLYVSDGEKYKYGCYDGRSVVMKYDAHVQIYVSVAKKVLEEARYGFSKGDIFLEVLEFGHRDSLLADTHFTQLKSFFNDFAINENAKFIRYSKKEKEFKEFYDMIEWDADLSLNECYIQFV